MLLSMIAARRTSLFSQFKSSSSIFLQQQPPIKHHHHHHHHHHPQQQIRHCSILSKRNHAAAAADGPARILSQQQHRSAAFLFALFANPKRYYCQSKIIASRQCRRNIHGGPKAFCAAATTTSSPTTATGASVARNSNYEIEQVDDNDDDDETSSLFYASSEYDSFVKLGIQSPILLQRLQHSFQKQQQKHQKQQKQNTACRPSRVQAAAFPIISSGQNVIVGAETGSGKTLAYLLPLMDDILQRKQLRNGVQQDLGYDFARALILVPNKELVQQVLRMAVDLCGGPSCLVTSPSSSSSSSSSLNSWSGGADNNKVINNDGTNQKPDPHSIIRMAVLPGGLSSPQDFAPFRHILSSSSSSDERTLSSSSTTTTTLSTTTQPVIDLLISTPAAIAPWGSSPKHIEFFADIRTVVMDEADMLLDGGYLHSLEQVLLGFKRADRLEVVVSGQIPKTQHVFIAATLPNSGLKSVEAYLERKFPRIHKLCLDGMHNAKHSGLRQQPTLWYCVNEKKERMQRLVQMLKTTTNKVLSTTGTNKDDGNGNDDDDNEMVGLQGDKVMVFLNTVQDVDAACLALNRVGIPCVPYHAKLTLAEKSENLERFRRFQPTTTATTTSSSSTSSSSNGQKDDDDDHSRHNKDKDKDGDAGAAAAAAVPVLICTDLASRGLDVPGVTAVVQLQFAGNVVAHLHRMGRCGRAGTQGRGMVFYSESERELVQVVQEAEQRQDDDKKMVLVGNNNVQDMELPEDVDDDDDDENATSDDDDDDDVAVTTTTTTRAKTSAVNSGPAAAAATAAAAAGSVQNAFSRRRGFSKKRKKLRREDYNDNDDDSNQY